MAFGLDAALVRIEPMTVIPIDATPRLTSLAHGGGCGCKLAPAVLQSILKGMPATASFADLMVGTDTSDDAAVWRLNDSQALVATTDFFMPVVDDPFDFGRIAATNALSDVYAMGGRPLTALNIAGFPVGTLPLDVLAEILRGGSDKVREAGVTLVGGHTVDDTEPKYGLSVTGLIHPDKIFTNAGAQDICTTGESTPPKKGEKTNHIVGA